MVQSQTHRLWEQVRKAAASSSQHSCCKLLLYPLPMAHCSEENIFSKQQFKIACHCLHQQPSVSHSPQLGLCGPWCVHRGGPAIPATISNNFVFFYVQICMQYHIIKYNHYYLLKKLSFPTVQFWLLCQKSGVHRYVDFCLGLHSSLLVNVVVLCQYHTVFITITL